MIRFLQEHLAMIQLQGGNNLLLEWIMLKTLKGLQKIFPDIWMRNSYYFKAHHPLVSDIDLSYLGDIKTAKAIHQKTLQNKILGELNFYPTEIFADLIFLINPYELKRDPKLTLMSPPKRENSTHKEVFLLRHITGDYYWLLRNPLIRQKKWSYLLDIINEPIQLLSLSHLEELSNHKEALQFYFRGISSNLFLHFKNSPFRALFPHKHIWETSDEDFLTHLSLESKEILIEQVKWEFWGIGTQLHWIDLKISYEYLARLKNVVIHIGADQDLIHAMDNVLNFMNQQFLTTR